MVHFSEVLQYLLIFFHSFCEMKLSFTLALLISWNNRIVLQNYIRTDSLDGVTIFSLRSSNQRGWFLSRKTANYFFWAKWREKCPLRDTNIFMAKQLPCTMKWNQFCSNKLIPILLFFPKDHFRYHTNIEAHKKIWIHSSQIQIISSKVIIEKSRGEGPLREQDTIENVS